ncbi:MAG: RAMP superfamily CRISPR-associated protein [Anaerolineae bacterium]
MNPYDFVRMDWSKGVKRRPAINHDHFEGLSGRIEGTITTLTPFFIPRKDNRSPKQFLTNAQRQAVIPGSSLKGLIRSLVETVGYGCWWLFDGTYEGGKANYKSKLPRDFEQCRDASQLCVACRMFGLIKGGTLLLGHVGFDDAVCDAPVPYDTIYTPILDAPKPRHSVWYLGQDGKVAGRKFYFHSTVIRTLSGIKRSKSGVQLNQYIAPIGANSKFTFSAHFDNLAQDELALLLYALVLEPGMRHKLGYAKPAGLGSVEIALTRLELVDYRQRYTSPDGGRTVYTGAALKTYVDGQIAPYVDDKNSVTLQDLRRIWKWPGRDDLRYPDRYWFDRPENKNKPISKTP